VGATLLPEILG